MPEAIFAADRGYNSKETISFISDVLGASLIGTHKRDLWYPYVFGDGPISRRHKGMVVSEKGCRAVYTARLKSDASGASRSQVRCVEACLYRESCSGRIAALIHNNARLFPSRCFTVVLREAFRSTSAAKKLDAALTVYDENLGQRLRGSEDAIYCRTSGKNSVEQVMNRVTLLTYYQSEDPVWFLLRAFRFTSRTAHGFIAAVARDFELRVKGTAWLLRGKRLSTGAEAIPDELELAEQRVKARWENVVRVLGLRVQAIPRHSSRQTLAQQIGGYSQSRMNSFTKSELQRMLGVFERGLETRATKAELVAALLHLKSDIENGSVDVEGSNAQASGTEEEIAEEASQGLCDSLREASLVAWVMKPLVTTMGMREGSRNEIEIVKALRRFFDDNTGAYSRITGSSDYGFDSSRRFDIRHVRTKGLVESQMCTMLADSPDAIVAATNEDDLMHVFAVEIKTMTAVRTIESASAVAEKYGPVIALVNVGTDGRSTEMFRELVTTTQYRAQVLHHAATLGLNSVLFVVGTGGSMTEGKILYACLIEFTESFRHCYSYVMDCVRVAAFGWIGSEARYIPKEYDLLLKSSHASDIFSFMSYYNLSQAIRRTVRIRGDPIPPCRMLRLTPTVYWNHLKGGVDVVSRYLRTLARSNISENPVVSILGRLLSMQICNAAVAYRLHTARKVGVLPRSTDGEGVGSRGYWYFRHRVTQCETFGKFARMLAKEWVEMNEVASDRELDASCPRTQKISPTFARNAAEKYNLGTHKLRRLNNRLEHKRISAQPTYCVLCSWALRGTKNGKMKIRRKGSRQIQWCSTCKQAICSICWTDWHSKSTLKRARPTNAEVTAFEQSIRSKRQRST